MVIVPYEYTTHKQTTTTIIPGWVPTKALATSERYWGVMVWVEYELYLASERETLWRGARVRPRDEADKEGSGSHTIGYV